MTYPPNKKSIIKFTRVSSLTAPVPISMKFFNGLSISQLMLVLYLRIETVRPISDFEIGNQFESEVNDSVDDDDENIAEIYEVGEHIPTYPSISNFWPKVGLWEGGMNVTIEGKRLGSKFKDIRESITVAGVPCTPYKKLYQPRSITCLINQSSPSPYLKGPIKINLNGTPITSVKYFEFVDPKITDISPKQGPIYGGTELTIEGENLDAGTSIGVFIGNTSCTLLSNNSSTIKCINAPSDTGTEKEDKVFMKFDGNFRYLTNDSFKYIKHEQRDERGFNYEPKGILSGGIKTLIRGVYPLPKEDGIGRDLFLYMHYGEKMYSSSCSIDSITTWICFSPSFSDIQNGSIDVESPIEMNISFEENSNFYYFSKQPFFFKNQPSKFWLYPDPVFYDFQNSFNESGENNFVIIINGENIDKACQISDIRVNVNVGTSIYSCEVKSITSNQLTCSLPTFLPSDPTQQDYVTVSIGDHFKTIVPKKNIPSPMPQNSITKYIIFVFTVLVAVAFLIIVFNFIIRKKIMVKHSHEIRVLQQQVNIMGMEAIVAKESMKRVIIKNDITLDENLSRILV